MAAQFTYDKVEQGTAVLLGQSPNNRGHVGTDGLAVCLGVHVYVHSAQGDARFVAHFDCEAVPKSKDDAAKVANWVQQWLTGRLGAYDANRHFQVATFSGGTDYSTLGMHMGVCQWKGANFNMTRQDNFWAPYGEGDPSVIPAGNLGQSLGQGQWPCSVPADLLGPVKQAGQG